MAKDKKLSAKVNGVKVEDGERVTLVIQATVSIRDQETYNGTKYMYVTFESDEDKATFDTQWFEADRDDDGKKFTLSSATIIRTKS